MVKHGALTAGGTKPKKCAPFQGAPFGRLRPMPEFRFENLVPATSSTTTKRSCANSRGFIPTCLSDPPAPAKASHLNSSAARRSPFVEERAEFGAKLARQEGGPRLSHGNLRESTR